MPIFFQQQIDPHTRLGIWQITEPVDFFKQKVPLHRKVTHPHKQLQHLAGRYLLPYLFPDFPAHLVRIAETRKPYLPGDQFHFSISHCGDFAAAIVSRNQRVGIDVEIPVEKILKIQHKFISPAERISMFRHSEPLPGQMPAVEKERATLIWSAKEAVFKWYGNGGIDFRLHIQLEPSAITENILRCNFSKTDTFLAIHYKYFDNLVLTWVAS